MVPTSESKTGSIVKNAYGKKLPQVQLSKLESQALIYQNLNRKYMANKELATDAFDKECSLCYIDRDLTTGLGHISKG